MFQPGPAHPRLLSIFRFIIAKRWWWVALYGLLLGPSIFYALKVEQDNSPDKLVVKSDPDYLNNQAFEKVFGGGEYVLLLLEMKDPWAPDVLRRVDRLEDDLEKIPRVEVNSALGVFKKSHNGFAGSDEEAAAFRKFATGTELFRRQGLVGDHELGLPVILSVKTSKERAETLAAVDRVLAGLERDPAPLEAIHKVGMPYVNAYLDAQMRVQSMRYFPLFALFVVVINLVLYRSVRTLIAFMVVIGASAAMTVGYIGLTGGEFTIVSSMVPLTILITCTATLVYIHSRFVDHPPGRTWEEHQVFALANKFLACSASVFATAVGFAALAVSKIRPVRMMGIWVAIGLVFTWLLVFTLFPALQRILRTPTEQGRKAAGQWFIALTLWLPRFSYRWRWLLVPGALVMCALGAVALFGLPFGLLSPMELQVDPVDYIAHDARIYKDTKRLEQTTGGLSLTEVWLKSTKFGAVTDPKVVRGLDRFQRALAEEKGIGQAIGVTSVLRMLSYVGGHGDAIPTSDDDLDSLTASVETLLTAKNPDGTLREPNLSHFIDPKTLAQTHIALISKTADYKDYLALDALVRRKWGEAVARDPALKTFELKTTGLSPLQAKIGYYLVPTLTESFALTVVVIFGTFLLVFRNGAARVMAMIPSLFAILVMFGIMRLTGMNLNAATILIASTVLGTSENDQIHFFYHFLEKKDASAEKRLQHTYQIAGRAIFFATLINSVGFLAFAMATLPPIRQFGILSALAFVLSMIADFTALPAALWLVFRERPDAERPDAKPAGELTTDTSEQA